MDATLIQALATLVLGSGGLLGLLNYMRARRAKHKGMPSDEHAARRAVDDSAINKYWQQEVATFRKERAAELAELRREISTLRHLRHLDAVYIDDLEEHIWMRREPPPPKRREDTQK